MTTDSPAATLQHFATGFAPIYRQDARILILGSLPGQTSLQQQQYYAHSQNAFWRILDQLFEIPLDAPYQERCQLAIARGLAIWDVCHSAQRQGSLDSQIQSASVVANPIHALLKTCPQITCIAFNGQAAARLYKRQIQPAPAITTVTLPSTSPAHAQLRFEEKLACWSVLQTLRLKPT